VSLLLKLLGIFAIIGVGWVAGKTRMLGPGAAGTLGAATFGLFTPALLFRTTATLDLSKLPWEILAAYYGPTMSILLLVYVWQRSRRSRPSLATATATGSATDSATDSAAGPADEPSAPARPAVRALSVSFSNSAQLGIPVVTALFGAAGLAYHVTLVSLQALLLLSTGTILAEIDLARAQPLERAPWRTAASTARRAFIHPVVLPVVLGLAYNAVGLGIPGPVDEVLSTLGQAVVPVSLVTIGLTLAQYGLAGTALQAVILSAGKLVVQPTVVFAVAYWGFGLRGLPLTIAVLFGALPIGSNVLLFAQRYEVLEAETTAAIVTSTVAFLATGTAWLVLLSYLGTR
jgi:predicted permease